MLNKKEINLSGGGGRWIRRECLIKALGSVFWARALEYYTVTPERTALGLSAPAPGRLGVRCAGLRCRAVEVDPMQLCWMSGACLQCGGGWISYHLDACVQSLASQTNWALGGCAYLK